MCTVDFYVRRSVILLVLDPGLCYRHPLHELKLHVSSPLLFRGRHACPVHAVDVDARVREVPDERAHVRQHGHVLGVAERAIERRHVVGGDVGLLGERGKWSGRI